MIELYVHLVFKDNPTEIYAVNIMQIKVKDYKGKLSFIKFIRKRILVNRIKSSLMLFTIPSKSLVYLVSKDHNLDWNNVKYKNFGELYIDLSTYKGSL